MPKSVDKNPLTPYSMFKKRSEQPELIREIGGTSMPYGGNDWLALTEEPTLEPEIPICDPHHHFWDFRTERIPCLLYTSPSPRDRTRSRMPSSA